MSNISAPVNKQVWDWCCWDIHFTVITETVLNISLEWRRWSAEDYKAKMSQ